MSRKTLIVFLAFFLVLFMGCGKDETQEKNNNNEAITDNSSYYHNVYGHPVAETKEGFYLSLDNLLYYVDKETLTPVMLSTDNYTWKELSGNDELKQASDAYAGLNPQIFFVNGKLYLCEEQGFYRLPREGGQRSNVINGDVNFWNNKICYSKGYFYLVETKLGSEGNSISSIVPISEEKGNIGDIISFPDELDGGKDITVQEIFPFKDKIYLSALLSDEDSPIKAYLFDKDQGKGKIFEEQDFYKGQRYGTQLINEDEGKLMRTICPAISQNKKPLGRLQYIDDEGNKVETDIEREIPWPQVCISNGKYKYEVPSGVTWISKAYGSGNGDLEENSKVKMFVKNLQTGKETFIEDSLVKKHGNYMCSVTSDGWCLIYGSDKLLIINSEGLHLINPEGHKLLQEN